MDGNIVSTGLDNPLSIKLKKARAVKKKSEKVRLDSNQSSKLIFLLGANKLL